MLGAPGVGKGTIASMLVNSHGFIHLSTGDLLREAIKNETDEGRKAKEYMDAGLLVPDELVVGLLKRKMDELGVSRGIIFDGFPRTVKQAEMLKEIVDIDKVVDLEVDDQAVVDRISNRRICQECNAVYNIVTNPPPKNNKCECGGSVIQREDDQPDAIRKRLKVYHDKTEPLIQHYKDIMVRVDASKSIGEVFENAEKALGFKD